MVTITDISGPKLALSGLVLILLYRLVIIIYRLTLHPLARFPGPFSSAVSRLSWVVHLQRGDLAVHVHRLHESYGPVVRIAPDELSFASPEAWKDIYGHRGAGEDEFQKYEKFYVSRFVPRSIITENRERHGRLRRLMANGFSDRSLRAQEGIIGGYVDLLVTRLRALARGEGSDGKESEGKSEMTNGAPKPANSDANGKHPAKVPVDMRSWYNWTTFDIIGDLAFGEPFGCLERGTYDPWVRLITESIRQGATIQSLKYLGLDGVVLVFRRWLMRGREGHMRRVGEKMERRMALEAERPDLIEGLIRSSERADEKQQQRRPDAGGKQPEPPLLDDARLKMNASTLIIAGSETTATLLSGATYLLLRNPDALRRVADEVRASFAHEADITLLSVSRLNYLLACLNEALRVYPPVPIGLPRQLPAEGATIAGKWIPGGTVLAVWQYAIYHSSALWTDPFAYRPERFLGTNPIFADDKLDALQPFHVGPRNCIGRNLAYAEMRLILAKILYNFDLELAKDSEGWMEKQKAYFLWWKPPLNVYLTPCRALEAPRCIA